MNTAPGITPQSAQRPLSEAPDAAARVIAKLAHEQHAQRRATQQALRRRR